MSLLLYASGSNSEFKQIWTIRCSKCGKFISRKDIEDNKAKYHFIPDSQFGPEESYWEHVKCPHI